jgi:hypothetical protein
MSDHSQGEGWWQASDGKWYPPDQAVPPVPPTQPVAPFGSPPPQPFTPAGAPSPGGPPPTPGPAPAPRKSGLGTGPIIGIVAAAVAIIAVVVFFATKDDGDKKNAAATNSSSSTRSSSDRSSSSSSSSSSSGAPSVEAPNGFQVFSNDEEQFALALPESMEVIDLSASDVDSIIDNLTSANPSLAALGPQIRAAVAQGGKLFAIDQSKAGSGFADNINIIASPGEVDVTNAGARSQLEQQLGSIGGTNIQFDTTNEHGRDILTVSYEATVNTADGTPKTFFGRQAYVPAAGQLWVITLSTGEKDTTVFDTVVRTFDVNE